MPNKLNRLLYCSCTNQSKLMKLINCDGTPAQLPAVPGLCQPHDDTLPSEEPFLTPKDQRDEHAVTLVEGVNTIDSDLLNQPSALISSFKSLSSLVDTAPECVRTSTVLNLPMELSDLFVCHVLSAKLNAGIKLPPNVGVTTENFIAELNFAKPYQYVYFGT